MFKILSKREIDDMNLFYNYINLLSCPTDFAIGSGLLDFRNEDGMLCASYYVNDSHEMINSRILYVSSEGKYKYISKLDKYLCGVRLSTDYSLVKDKSSIGYIDNNIGYLEYGTGVSISLPISKNMLGKSEYSSFSVFKEKFTNNYFIEYPIYGLVTRIRDKCFYDRQKAYFLIEPLRFWVDYKSDTIITQDVILGGVPYKMYMPYEYDDYDESDLCEAVSVVEKDIDTLTKLINGEIKIKRK